MHWFIIAAFAGYLLGSIPFGLLITRMAGLGDIRQVGSGNIGATNVLRTGRKDLAFATLLLDSFKAGLAVLLIASISGERNVGLVAGGVRICRALLSHLAGLQGWKGRGHLCWPPRLCIAVGTRRRGADLADLVCGNPDFVARSTDSSSVRTAGCFSSRRNAVCNFSASGLECPGLLDSSRKHQTFAQRDGAKIRE